MGIECGIRATTPVSPAAIGDCTTWRAADDGAFAAVSAGDYPGRCSAADTHFPLAQCGGVVAAERSVSDS